tara:strand:+ start:42 stop:623 length:582 start_codon:yes stop_codon:yes gene_type:complete
MDNITNEEFQWLEEKYGKLLHHIAYRIGGDSITNDHEDSYQNLCIAMLDTVNTFDRKQTEPFSEYKDTKHFDKYLKTVLWNRKNNIGNKIVKREPLRKQVTIDEKILHDQYGIGVCKSAIVHPDENKEPFSLEGLSGDMQELIDQVTYDAKVIKPSGDFNVSRLCRNLGKTKSQVKHTIEQLKHTLKSYDETN